MSQTALASALELRDVAVHYGDLLALDVELTRANAEVTSL